MTRFHIRQGLREAVQGFVVHLKMHSNSTEIQCIWANVTELTERIEKLEIQQYFDAQEELHDAPPAYKVNPDDPRIRGWDTVGGTPQAVNNEPYW